MRRSTILPLALLFVAGCAPPPAADVPAPPLLEIEQPHKGDAVTPEERMVAKQLLQLADGNGYTIQFIRWGPHDYSGCTHVYDPKDLTMIRVVTERRSSPKANPTFDDAIYKVGDASVVGAGGPPIPGAPVRMVGTYILNRWDDDWRAALHKTKLTDEAGLKEAEQKAKGK